MIGLKYLYAMLAGAFSGQPALNVRGRRPTSSELRNPADPVQARRIEAAAAKRARRAEKLHRVTVQSRWNNMAHKVRYPVPGGTFGLVTPGRLDPQSFTH